MSVADRRLFSGGHADGPVAHMSGPAHARGVHQPDTHWKDALKCPIECLLVPSTRMHEQHSPCRSGCVRFRGDGEV